MGVHCRLYRYARGMRGSMGRDGSTDGRGVGEGSGRSTDGERSRREALVDLEEDNEMVWWVYRV